MGFSRLGLAIGGAIVISVAAGCLTWANRRTSQSFVDDAGHYWHLHFPCAGLAVYQKRAARRLLERDA